MIKIMNGKPVIVDEDGKTRVLFDNLPGDIGGTPGYNELLEDVENLMDYVYGTDVYKENKTPYFFRASGGGVDVGICENDTLVGGSVGWNQLAERYGTVKTVNGVTFTQNVDGSVTVSGTATANAISGIYNQNNTQIIVGHKYLLTGCPSGGGNYTWQLSLRADNGSTIIEEDYGSGKIVNVGTAPTNPKIVIYMRVTNGVTINAKFVPQLVDLTLLLGSTIADRLYTLEQSTAGSGIAQLRAWGFDFSEYIPYCAPTLKHVEGVSEHRFVGFNQWDEQLESGTIGTNGVKVSDHAYVRSKNYIPVLPSTEYFVKTGSSLHRVFFYDANKEFISFGYSTNANGKVYTTPTNCHYMLFRPENTYGTTYNHDICINLSNSSKNGTYEPYRTWNYALDSTLTLRGVPKLDASNNLYFDGDIYEPDGTVTRYCAIRAYESGDESLADAITDGTNTVYKLSTPTTETATPYTEYQEVDANGTEEYVSTGVVPVGHTTKYPVDLKAKLEQILEGVPTTDGTYVLTATVSSGIITYSWESAG